MNGWLASVQAGQAPTVADQWTSIGPAPVTGGQFVGTTANPRVSGRIIDITVDPNQPATHWFAAAEFGGIWETTDGGTSWTPKTDTVLTQGMSVIAIAPSNPQILFAGTHDISGVGVALLKSTDGGSNWAPTGSFFDQGSFTFTAIEVHPTNPSIVMAVTWQGSQPANGGVFKSTNGGATFTQKLPGTGTALHVNPMDFNQQYASIYGATQYNGIFRSFNGGDTWLEMSGPWDPVMAQGGGAVEICGSPSSPGTVYVVVPGGGIWKTQNAWDFIPTWTALPAAPGGYNSPNTAMVDPTDPSIFYMGGWGDPFYRFNPAQDPPWSSILNSTHVDQQALAAAGSTILLGNDGGFWTSTDRGATWTNKNSNLATIMFYAGSLHPTDALQALGGSQDNGTEWWSGNAAWKFVWYGDGGYSAFGVSNSDAWLVSSQFLGIIRLRNEGTVNEWGQNGLDPGGAGFIAPIRRSPHSDIVLAGSDNLWKSTNFFNIAVQPSWFSNGPEMGVEIGAIAFAPFDTSSLTYAFGTAYGALRSTTSGGGLTRWKDLDPAPGTVPNRFVKGIAYHPTDPNIMYVSLSGFDEHTPGAPGHVFKTVNATAASPTWTNVTPPGLNLPINCLAIDPATPTTIYAGADLGVWKSTNSGASGSWAFMGPGKGMPNVPVLDLLFSPVDGRLVAYTFGRGAFKLNVGSLQVTILPAGAVAAGAKWKVDDGKWQNSGTTVVGLAPGNNHTVYFNSIYGYSSPANQTVTISNNQTTQTTGVYSPWW